MKKCCVAILLLGASAASAAEVDRAKFIDFTGTVIDGHVAKPATIWMESHQRARFERLLTLKKSMNEALSNSANDPVLR